jgi:endonuclease/exonuclease/phosphatase (EEP) superfamily protein YafD
MTYNVNYGNPDVAGSIDAIAEVDADVVLLQEITREWRDELQLRLAARYPHQVFHVVARAAGGLAVLSRLRIDSAELWAPPAGTGAWFPAERIVVTTTASGPVQLLNVHLRPALDQGGWVTGYLNTPPIRRKEIAAHWRHIDYQLPTVVAGDFNEDAGGRAIEFLAEHGLTRVATTGPTTWHYETWRGGVKSDLLQLDIDHVLIDGHFVARDAHVVDAGASDHRPVVVTLALK